MKKIIALLLLTGSLNAQNLTTENEQAYIEISSSAEKEVIPDEIFINIVLKEDESKDKRSIAKQEKTLKDSLSALGINLSNLTLLNSFGNYRYTGMFSKDVVESAEYILKVSDAKTVGKVFEKLDHCSVSSARISKISHSKIEDFKKEIRIAAIKSAKEKSDYLLTSIGAQTGKPLIVREEQVQQNPYQYRDLEANANYSSAAKMNWQDDAIQFEKIVIKANVFVKFEIK